MIHHSRKSLGAVALPILAAALAGVCSPAFATTTAPSYTIFDLGTLGGPTSSGYAINKAGVAAGVSTVNSTTNNHDGFWENRNTLIDVGTLGGTYSTAQGLNDLKVVVGESTTSAGWYNAFIYQTTPMHDLGTLGGNQSDAYAINDNGIVVGAATDSGGQFHAFYYKAPTMTEIPMPNDYYSVATAITPKGVVAGEWTPSPGTNHAFMYNIATKVFTDLGAPTGYTSAEATAINGQKIVVGVAGTNPSVAFFRAPDRMRILPSLGGTQSAAEGIDDYDNVVGYSYTAAGVSHAFIYNNTTRKTTDLNNDIAPGSGWVLNAAYGINANGQIVGVGTYNGAQRGFVLTPVATAS